MITGQLDVEVYDFTNPSPMHRAQIEAWTGRSRRTVFRWIAESQLTPVGVDRMGRELYAYRQVLEVECRMRQARGGRPATRRTA